jgi:hypothetical protein
MSIADSIPAQDRDLMRRITIVLAFVFLFTAAFARLHALYSHKFLSTTGEAQWIWAQHRMSSQRAVAFFAVRDFTLPAKRYFTRLKVVGDPEYTVWVNGSEIGGRRIGEERRLDLYEISGLVKTGKNRIVVAVRAPEGIGGLIASVDIAPETANVMVTDGAWKIFRDWHRDLPRRDPRGAGWQRPAILGAPPLGRWNYLTLAKQPLVPPPSQVIAPRESFPTIALVPHIRTRSGIAVAVAERARATAFDFGFTRGRVRLVAEQEKGLSRIVNLRFANVRNELGLIEWNLRPVVIAPGETVVTTPEAHSFRYVMVIARGVRAEVAR